MKKIDIIIKNQSGIHIRPATKIVNLTNQYPNCKVEIIYNNAVIDTQSIIGILALGINYGSKITLAIQGKEEEHVSQELITLFRSSSFLE